MHVLRFDGVGAKPHLLTRQTVVGYGRTCLTETIF